MATSSVTVDVDYGGTQTAADLQEAIAACADLMGQTTKQATIATTIRIERSLRKQTTVAIHGKNGNDLSFWSQVPDSAIRVTETNLYGGLCGRPAKVCARVGSPYGKISPIRPAIFSKIGKGNSVFSCRVYAVYTTNKYDTFSKNVNKGHLCWFVLCRTKDAAIEYGKRRVAYMLNKEGGMAKYALGVAMAKTNDVGGEAVAPPSGSKQMKIAHDAACVEILDDGFCEGNISVEVNDKLNYSELAAGGIGATAAAIEKATRATIHMLYAKFGDIANIPLQKKNIAFMNGRGDILQEWSYPDGSVKIVAVPARQKGIR